MVADGVFSVRWRKHMSADNAYGLKVIYEIDKSVLFGGKENA